jgi:signal transduction histidine kinase
VTLATPFTQAYEELQPVLRDSHRLAAVRNSGLLDSDVEEAFDRLTRLAVRLIKVPAAFVSLVDENRDFYKSACGFGEPLASSRQLEGPTFCHFTIQTARPLIIPDTAADPVYRDVPTVKSLGVAAYVGIPIVVGNQVIGAFCAIDSKPHDWTDDEVMSLEELAAVAVSEITLRGTRDELERARSEAERANRAKSDFLASMSHDLRTPLNAIAGYAQLIEMGVHGPVNEAQKDAAARIIRAERHLFAIINDILQFAKTESGEIPLSMERISMEEVCSTLESLAGQQAKARNIDFTCSMTPDADGELSALADMERVIQVLLNLTTNALKFTPEGGSISVTGNAAGAWTEIHVRDTGRGISADHIEKIFEPFVQVTANKGTKSGVGLGLATSRNLARRMQGDILVESIEGVGSTFTLILPAA